LYADFPFYSESMSTMYDMILNWKDNFGFPEDKEVSAEAKDLLQKLICDKKDRLGARGIDELKRHPFFKDIDWENLRNSTTLFLSFY